MKMTPKEKAELLVAEFKAILMQEDTDCGHECLCSIIAIKNAQIVVREVMPNIDQHEDDLWQYWFEVDQELNKM